MAQQAINIGAAANDRTGDTWRDAFVKVNENTAELYGFQASNTVVINQESDFPTQDATTITLETGYSYIMGDVVSTAKRFIVQQGAGISSTSHGVQTLTYTGTGVMFTCTEGLIMNQLNFSCPNGTLFNITSSLGSFVIMRNSICESCASIGDVSSAGIAIISASIICQSGLSFTGTGNRFLFRDGEITATTVTNIVDLGTAVFDDFRLFNYTLSGPSGTVAIAGTASSANIASGITGAVSDCTLNKGVTTPLSGIDPQDVRWSFTNVDGVADSRNTADGYITATTTVVIAASSTFEEIDGGAWLSTVQDRFTTSVSGVVTYNGEDDISVHVNGLVTMAKVGGGLDEIEARVAKNWTSGGGEVQSGGTTQNANPTSVPVLAIIDLSPGDDIRLIVANNTTTANIDVSKAALTISEA
jgi:hypothetical protein